MRKRVFATITLTAMAMFLLSLAPFSSALAIDNPPLPLHGLEGYSGIASTYTAYMANSPQGDDIFGLPSLGVHALWTEHGKFLGAVTVTEVIAGRLELGYAFNFMDLDDLPDEIRDATFLEIDDDTVHMHNFNARLMLIKDGDFGQSWMPAVTIGAHYKYNSNIEDIDKDLFGTLESIGIKNKDGMDYTLYVSKKMDFLPMPLLVNLGLRSTKAAHIGLFGFTDDRETLFEGSLVAFLSERFTLGVEYREKPDEYTEIPNLVEQEDDWWAVIASYVVNEHMTVSASYFNLGHVLNHEENAALGLKAKWEF